MRRSTTALGILALAGAGLSAGPATAADGSQATAYTDDGSHAVYYTAGADELNDVTITAGSASDSTDFIINDQVPITAGEGCVHPDDSDPTYVVCTLTESGDYWTNVIVDLGDKTDRLTNRAGDENSIDGGPGDDALDGTGRDRLLGGEGNDTLVGAGTAHGGPGHDTISAFHFSAYGDDGGDVIVGRDRGESIYGGRGDDTILGQEGNDRVYGNSGEDTVYGGPGGDDIYGGPDDDVLYGNSGGDLLDGGPGTDRLSGGPGTDEIRQG